MIMSKHGSILQPQLHKIKIKIIIQVQSPQPVLQPQPQSFPPKNLLNIVPPKICITKAIWRLQFPLLLHITLKIKKSYGILKFP